MKPKMMTQQQLHEKRWDVCHSIAKKALEEFKRTGVHVGNVDITQNGVHWMISIENSEKDCDVLAALVDSHTEAIFIAKRQFDGKYDWMADTYIKPTGMVTIKF